MRFVVDTRAGERLASLPQGPSEDKVTLREGVVLELPPVLLGVEEAAKGLSVGRTEVFIMIRQGRLRSIKRGRRRLIPKSELDRFVREELGK